MRPLLAAALLIAGSCPNAWASEPAAPPSYNALQIPAGDVRAKAEQGMLAWLRGHARPFAAADASAAELAPLLDVLGTPRVIALGEITHGTHEDLAFKSAVIRALVERGGIDVLVFELNRRTGARLDRFVAKGSAETDAATAMKDAKVYSVWMTQELADLLDWLRRWNATSATPVGVVGVDVQDASADLADALDALQRIDARAASGLRARLADWLTDESRARHQSVTVAALDKARWRAANDAAGELEAALRGRDAAGHDAAEAARHAIAMLEYDVPGMAASFIDVPDDVISRRDIAMGERLVAAVPAGRRAILWAHDGHVARSDAPYGFGLVSMGAHLHHRLGRRDYRVLTFSAREIDFNAKGVASTRQADRTTPFSVWRYTARPEDLGAFFARTGRPRFWIDLDALPPGEASVVFRFLSYGRPSFGWAVSEPFYPFLPTPFGYGSDVIVHFDRMTPSRRLP